MIYINNTEDIFREEDARKWMRAHVVVKRSDLKKIAALAKKLGFYKELKALNVEMQELKSTRHGE